MTEKKNYGLFKKLILKILICLVIYFIFYLIQNNNYIFSEEVINQTKQILSYDINIPEIWNNISNQLNSFIEENRILMEEEKENTINENSIQQNTIDENVIHENSIGGAEVENVIMEDINISQISNEEEKVQTDDEYIKTTLCPIKPVEGIVSSEFGEREATSSIVSKNHTGIDIAANTGTKIIASIDGTVTISSKIGDYGYHIKITNNDVSTLYAHCSKLYVNVGDTVKKRTRNSRSRVNRKINRTSFTF